MKWSVQIPIIYCRLNCNLLIEERNTVSEEELEEGPRIRTSGNVMGENLYRDAFINIMSLKKAFLFFQCVHKFGY